VKFGGVRILLDAEFLERIDRGLNPGAALVLFGDVYAVEKEPGLRSGDATDDVAVDDLRPDGAACCRSGGSSATPDVRRASSWNPRPLSGRSTICSLVMTSLNVADSVLRSGRFRPSPALRSQRAQVERQIGPWPPVRRSARGPPRRVVWESRLFRRSR